MILACKRCGVEFERTVRAPQVYCSAVCRRAVNNEKIWKPGYLTERNIAHPEKMMYRSAKHRAKKKGLPFDIELSDIVIPEFCPVLGIPLVCNAGTGAAKGNSPSLDKIIPELGYVKGNVQVISYRANMMKADASMEELHRFAEWVLTLEKQ